MNGYHNTVAMWLDCPTAKSGVLSQSLGPRHEVVGALAL